MNPVSILLWLWLIAVVAVVFAAMEVEAAPLAQTESQPHAMPITYQGRLQQDGVAANGIYDFEFHLFDAAETGNAIGMVVTVDDVLLDDGNFTVELDFGPGAFDGRTRYLAIHVRPGAESGDYTALAPRQHLTAAPLALSLPGFHSTAVSTTFNVHAGVISNSLSVGVVGAWVGGYNGAEPNRVTDHFGMVLGGANNVAGDDNDNPGTAMNALIVGGSSNTNGGTLSAIVGGRGNTVEVGGALSFIGGGRGNRAGFAVATIGGGIDNIATAQGAAIIGGQENKATDAYSTIGGGTGNLAGDNDGNPFSVTGATVAGGSFNSARVSAAFVGGGSNNNAAGVGAVVAGGIGNEARADNAAVGGGLNNVADGVEATVPGGANNVAAGADSFAGGKNAKAMGEGSFVWSDGTKVFTSTLPHQFWVLASGGALFDTGGAGVVLNPGSGAWDSLSDRNAKENLEPVDVWAVLEAVAELPMTTWNCRTQNQDVRHLGPMAQDFYAAFHLGTDERHISTIDADGVALASIQALYAQAQSQAARIDALTTQNPELTARLAALENDIATLLTAQEEQLWPETTSPEMESQAMPVQEVAP